MRAHGVGPKYHCFGKRKRAHQVATHQVLSLRGHRLRELSDPNPLSRAHPQGREASQPARDPVEPDLPGETTLRNRG